MRYQLTEPHYSYDVVWLFGIVLNRGAPFASDLVAALMQMLAPAKIFVSLDDI